MADAPPLPQAELPRVLSVWDATAVVVGGIIGSGIFFKAQVLATKIPAFGPIMSIWILAGLHTLCGMLCVAELASMLPQAGGPYVYLRAAYGRLMAFLWGWVEFWIIRSAALAALATASVLAFSSMVPLEPLMQQGMAIAIVSVLAAINFVATRGGALVQNLTTILKVSFLMVLILGPLLMGRLSLANALPIWPAEMSGSYWTQLGVAAIAVLWPYDGWINVTPVTEEIRNPDRNVPRALIMGGLLVTLLYVTVNISYHLTMNYEELAKSNGVAAQLSRTLFGPFGLTLAAAGIMTSTLGACNNNLLCAPRIYFAMARDGLLPKAIASVHGRYQTPHVAIVLQSVWANVLILAATAWVGSSKAKPTEVFDTLTDFAIFGGLLFYALVVAAVPILRYKAPQLYRPYRTWGYPLTPILYLLGSSGVMVAMLLEKWLQTIVGSTLIVAGILFYFWTVRWSPDPITPSESAG